MKHFKRLNLFKANNVTFNPETNVATSYDWWEFTSVINGKLVFNSYNYSPSTTKHQYKVRALLNELGINVDITIHSPKGFQDCSCLIESCDYYQNEIDKLNELINRPRSQKKKNIERAQEIERLEDSILEVRKLMVFNLFYIE